MVELVSRFAENSQWLLQYVQFERRTHFVSTVFQQEFAQIQEGLLELMRFLLALLFAIGILDCLSFRLPSSLRVRNFTGLSGKIAKAAAERTAESATTGKIDKNELISIPYGGLVGYEPNNLFYEPVDITDPFKNTDDLPGEDGSPEKIQAIQQRIQQRVEMLKQRGEWNEDGDVYGKDPLANMPLWSTMWMQVKACKPYDSFDDLLLTYILVIITTFAMAAYTVGAKYVCEAFVDWFLKTDFDADYFQNLWLWVVQSASTLSLQLPQFPFATAITS